MPLFKNLYTSSVFKEDNSTRKNLLCLFIHTAKDSKLESAPLVNLSSKVYSLPKTISISAKESDIIYRQRGGAEDFDCVTMKFTDLPHKALKYSYDAPLLAVNQQSIFFSPSLYSVGDD